MSHVRKPVKMTGSCEIPSRADTGNSLMLSALLSYNVGNIYLKPVETPRDFQGSLLETNKEMALWEK